MGDRDYRPDRPVFCGNFEYDARQDEIERLFERYGPIERVDMKTGFAFVYMRDKRDGDDAIRDLDRREFGYQRRRLCVEWARGDGAVKQREDLRRRQVKATTTLFVVNFDTNQTRQRDLERFFEPYGKLKRVQIKKNFAFIQFDTVEEAQDAKNSCHLAKMHGRVLTVEYVAHEDHNRVARPGMTGSDRARSRSPDERGRGRRSPSPRGRSPPRRSSPRGSPHRSPPPRRSPPRRDSRSPPRREDSPRRRNVSRSRSPVPRRTPSPSPGRGGSASPRT